MGCSCTFSSGGLGRATAMQDAPPMQYRGWQDGSYLPPSVVAATLGMGIWHCGKTRVESQISIHVLVCLLHKRL